MYPCNRNCHTTYMREKQASLSGSGAACPTPMLQSQALITFLESPAKSFLGTSKQVYIDIGIYTCIFTQFRESAPQLCIQLLSACNYFHIYIAMSFVMDV